MVEIKDIIEQNPWWRNKNWAEHDKSLATLKNSLFKIERKKPTKLNNVNFIYGTRQVGKTTLMKLMIEKLIKKVSGDKIAYFSCDVLLTNKREELRKAINYLLEKNLEYLFIDEISNVNEWGYEIKYFIDSGKFGNLKVFITGSPFGIKEHMPGRKINNFYLMPISFREFLMNLPANLNREVTTALNLKQSEVEEIKQLPMVLSRGCNSLKEINKEIKNIEAYSSLIEKLFSFYALNGGFPSIINSFIKYKVEKNKMALVEEIKTNKERLIDSLRKTGKNESICFQLINSIKKRVSSRYSFTQLKETEIDLSKETIINYITHLKNIFLLKILYSYDFGKMEIGLKKDKKIYLIDPFLYHEERIFEEEKILYDEEYLSKIVESITAINLSYLKEDILNPLESFLFFWYGTKEIDFVLKEKSFIGIEVKYREKIECFEQIDQIKDYIVLTKNMLRLEGKISFIPVFLFLALLKNNDNYL